MIVKILIDDEFKNLIPPLTDEEYKGLEDSIVKEGCRDALILWGNTLIDGHNRYEICTKHNIPFKTIQKDFKSRDEVLLWMMKNQLARRNLNDFQRIEITHKCENAVKIKAKAISLSNLKQNTEVVNLSPREESKTREELGKMAGVSGTTYEHAVDDSDILDEANICANEMIDSKQLFENEEYKTLYDIAEANYQAKKEMIE